MAGFIVNRIQTAMGREVSYLIQEGVVTPAGHGYRCQGQLRLPIGLPGSDGAG